VLWLPKIYSHEFVITELFSGKLFEQLNDFEICSLIAAIIYEPRRSDEFAKTKHLHLYDRLLKKIMYNVTGRDELDKENIKK
jgi:hypothetical protein